MKNIVKIFEAEMKNCMEHREKHMKLYLESKTNKEDDRQLNNWSYWSGRFDSLHALIKAVSNVQGGF